MADTDLPRVILKILRELRRRSANDASVLHYVLLNSFQMKEDDSSNLNPIRIYDEKSSQAFPVTTYEVQKGWTAADKEHLKLDNVMAYFTRIDADSGNLIDSNNTWDVYQKTPDYQFSRMQYFENNDGGIGLPGRYVWSPQLLDIKNVMMTSDGPISYPNMDSLPEEKPKISKTRSLENLKKNRNLFREDSAREGAMLDRQPTEGGKRRSNKKKTKRSKRVKKSRRSTKR